LACWIWLGTLLSGVLCGSGWLRAATDERDLSAAGQFAGRTVEAVRVVGNTQSSTSAILQLVRTREGDKFDPATVVGDYQRIYSRMKKFADVEARIQPTPTGVIVIFVVTEQKQINEIRYEGNVDIKTHD
jgi:outer membrane protein assembly factor BamA